MPKKSFDCYVHVHGEPSDPEDQSLPGVYLVEVQLSLSRERGTDLTAYAKSAMAAAALECFHGRQGIEVVDDFEIRVMMASGEVITEDELALVGFSAHASTCELVDLASLPDAVLAAVQSAGSPAVDLAPAEAGAPPRA